MAPSNRRVTSREYKLILKSECFQNRGEGAAAFWAAVQTLLTRDNPLACESQHDERRRLTWYLDTPGRDLERCGYILRVREEEGEKKPFKITLKYRHGDRYLSAHQQILLGLKDVVDEKDVKFEEDVVAPFGSKFSHSVSRRKKTLQAGDLDTVADAVGLFPVLGSLGLDPTAALVNPGDSTAHEIMRLIGRFTLDGTPLPPMPADPAKDTAFKASMTFWYPDDGNRLPDVAEFSFDYEADLDTNDRALEEYRAVVVAGADRLYLGLQELKDWVDPTGTTKTQFALGAM